MMRVIESLFRFGLRFVRALSAFVPTMLLMTATACAASGQTSVRIGLVDTFSPRFYINTYAPTILYLKEKLPQYRFVSVEYDSMRSLGDSSRLPVDFLVSSSGTYGILSHRFGAEHMLIRKTDSAVKASASTGSVFIVPAGSSAKSLADLKGLRAVAQSRESFDGWLTALDEIELQGHDHRKFFSSVSFTQYAFPDVPGKLLLGDADVGILPRCAFEEATRLRTFDPKAFRIIGNRSAEQERCARSTELYPAEVVSVLPETAPEIAKNVTVALLTMPKLDRNWEWVTVNDLVRVSGLLEHLRLGPWASRNEWTIESVVEQYWKEIALLIGLILAVVFHIFRVHQIVDLRTSELIRTIRVNEEMTQKAKRTQEYLHVLERSNIVAQLSALFAHEMMQPVTNIINYSAGLRMLQDQGQGGSDMSREAVTMIGEQARRIAGIVEHVRTYARQQSSEKVPCRLQGILTSTVENFRIGMKNRAQIVVECPEDLVLRGDPLALELLFLNLIRNAERALKATADPLIRIQAQRDENYALVRVTDNGPGMDEAVLSRLGRAGAVRNPEGLGMGLAIVAGIAEKHNGHAEFSRAPSGGLCASIWIALEESEQEKRT